MDTYRRNLGVRDKHKATALPARRFTYECAWACHQGTDDAGEFGRHIAECPHIFDGVRQIAARLLAAGKPVCVDPTPPPGDHPGQQEFKGMPRPGMVVKKRR